MIRRAILVAACALASCPAAAEPEEPITIDEATPVAIARTVDLDRGYFDVVFEGLRPWYRHGT